MTNVRLSNQAEGGLREPYFAESRFSGAAPDGAGLTFGNTRNVVGVPAEVPTALFALAPTEHFDFPKDVFEGDGNYTIKAWAENSDGTRISPQASVVLSVQQRASILNSDYAGYPLTPPRGQLHKEWDVDTDGLTLAVYGLSIQDN